MRSDSFSLSSGEGLPIRGDVLSPGQDGAPAVICIHGFKGFKDWGFWPEVARCLGEAGYGVVRFNFSHSGIGADPETFSEVEHFESGTYSREVEDVRTVVSRLAERRLPGSGELDVSRLGLLAHSRGSVSALAVAAAGDFLVRSVVLWNPVSSVLWWDEQTRRRWREEGFWETVNSRTGQVFRMKTWLLDDAEKNRERLHPVLNAGRLRVPVLAVVAAQDETVPPEAGRRIAAAAGEFGSVHEVPGTGHTFGAAHPFAGPTPALDRAIRATREHFDRTIAGVTA